MRTLAYNDGSNIGGFAFNYVIKANHTIDETFYLEIKYGEEKRASLHFSFMDCFMTEYVQQVDFIIDNDSAKIDGRVSIEMNYPKEIESVFK